jgi:hypothetical protein
VEAGDIMLSVGIIQPNFIPWRGYFDFIDRVDIFLFHDDLQYTKQDWRNRNKVRHLNGSTIWLTVPVKANTQSLIMDVEIDYSSNWISKHLNILRENYGRSPYFDKYFPAFKEIVSSRHRLLSDLDIALCQQVCDWLDIQTPLKKASDFGLEGVKDEKIIGLVQAVGGTRYLSGPAAKAYIQPDLWKEANLELEYIEYPSYPAYPQISEPFDPAVSVLDLLFMAGPDAPRYIWPEKIE